MTMLKSVMIIKFAAWAMVGKVGDPAKCNAQATRCTGGVKINGWDKISSVL